ncbi:MAG: dihydropteroate synthase [Flavobacteriales bacterium]|nr:dihydropteroate synthase [Flavobacteriales bacterium]
MSIKETVQDTFFLKKKSINCDGKIVNLDEPLVMGILNATPDSFFDGGKHTDEKNIIAFVKQQLADGAAIIDVGGYSSKPGAAEVSEKEELNRVIPVIRLLKQEFKDLIISIDTFRSAVAREAIKNGAGLINDISAGELDSKMFDVVAELNVTYIMMHMQGTPQTMQNNPTYQNVTKEVMNYFAEKVNVLHQKGVNDIILDPGFGFGKTLEHNYQLLRELNHFAIFELPVLVGLSRKSMITKALNISSKEALNGTTILNTLALTKGANILRVHDVKEANEVVKLFKLMEKS